MTEFDYTSEQLALKPKLADANISPVSFLATDYLNHFNEIVMLLEMVADMPDLVEEACEWAPKSYADHFMDSGFQDKALAIEAFDLAPASIRSSFEKVCNSLNTTILSTLSGLKHVGAADRGLTPQAQTLVHNRIVMIQDQLLTLNGIIHGRLPDEVVTKSMSEGSDDTETQSQEDIDKLFD